MRLYDAGIGGHRDPDLGAPRTDLRPLFDRCSRGARRRRTSRATRSSLQVTTLDYYEYLGRIIVGRVDNGVIRSASGTASSGATPDDTAGR